jgi:hypothetical protein
MTASQQLTAPTKRAATSGGHRGVIVALCVLSAGLMIVSGIIHLHLWNEYYKHIKTGHMNVLFLVQTIAAFVGALALLIWRHWIVVLGSAALMLGTAIGYLIARYHSGGLFGFQLPSNFGSSDATWSLTVEFASTVLLLLGAALIVRNARRTS